MSFTQWFRKFGRGNGRQLNLKQCPFCGEPNNISVQDRFCASLFFVYCDSCTACGGHADTKEGAIEQWNRRYAACTKPDKDAKHKNRSTPMQPCS